MNLSRLLVLSMAILASVVLACNLGAPRAGDQTLSVPTISATVLPTDALPAPSPATPSLPYTWQPAGFGGAGNFDGVFFDPNRPGVVYAPSDVTGIFRSTDNGEHWEMRSVGLGNYEVSSFAVDPFDSNTLYAGVGAIGTSNKSGIYVSHDAGLSWQHLTSTFTHTITFRRWRTINAIAPDPAQQGCLLSGSRLNGLWRSTDSGNTWTQVYSAPLTSAPQFTHYDDDPPDPHPAPVSIVIFDPVTPTIVYAGFDGGGAIKSWDSGLTWTPITGGLPAEATVKYLAVGHGDDVLYAAVGEAGVYRSDDGGDRWQAVNGFPPTVTLGADAWVSSVAVHPDDSDIAYLTLTTYNHPSVWKTTDGGATWMPTGDVTVDPVNDPTEAWSVNFPGNYYWPYTWSWQVTFDPHNSNRLYFVNFWDVLRSDDGGAHWFTKIAGAQNTCVTHLALDANTLYATHWDAGLLKSTNQGLTWTAVLPSTVNDPALSGHYWNVAIAQNGSAKYYYVTSDAWAQGYGQVLRSTDGVSWTIVFTNPRPAGTWMGGYMLGLAVDPATPATLYITQDGGQVWKSINNGNTWAPTTGQPGTDRSFTYALAVDDQHRVFAGTLRDGLWRSTNGGGTWEQVLTDQATIYHALAVPGAVYASAGDSNLYRSINGGDTWQKLTDSVSIDDGDGVGDQGMAIAVDPQNPNHILFSRQDTWHSADAGPGVVESLDDGSTWTPINAGLGNLSVSALSIGSNGDIFAGTACGGIWRRPASITGTLPNTYYVATGGHDNNPGTYSSPWRTIQKAANTLQPGDTVYVMGGVYTEAVTVTVSGSAAGGYITFQNYPGEHPILDGAGLAVPDGETGMFLIVDQSYLIIRGFEIRNYKTSTPDRVPVGIHIRGASHHIQIQGNHIHHIETNAALDPELSGADAHGIAVYGTAVSSTHHILIDHNELDHLKLGSSEALVVNGNVEVFTITHNLIHDNDNIGIDVIGFEDISPDPTYDQARDGIVAGNTIYAIDTLNNPSYGGDRSAGGIYVDGGTRILVEHNRVYSSNLGVELASEHAGRATSYVTVRNNLIYNNHVAGIAMGGYDAERGSAEHCTIVNNTLYNNGDAEILLQFDTRNNIIKNNILYAGSLSRLIGNDYTQNTANVVDYNLFFAPAGAGGSTWQWKGAAYTGFEAYKAGTGNDAHSLFANPQFSALVPPDLHLQATSPAIDKGETLAVVGTHDIDGEARVQGVRVDMGADERLKGAYPIYLPLILRSYASVAGPLPPAEVNYWGYQIQAINGTVDALVASRYDMLVLEPTRTDWSSDDKFFDTRAMVARLKNSKAHDGVHRKLVVAYIDIGQAEDWRWYWTWSTGWDCTGPRPADWPAYILTCDPDGWTGNYPVAYWDPAWKNIVITGTALSSAPYGDYVSILDEVIRDGFDGVYLDWVEGFENAEVIAAANAAGKDPAVEMITFIRQMKAYAAARKPGFIVIQQNAAALMDGHPELFNVIDAIAQEGIWYDGIATDDWNDPAGYDTPTDSTLTGEYLGRLDQYLNAGVPVFNCEYALNYAATAYTNASNKGYKPYVTRRSLGRLTTTPPPGY